MPIRNTRTNLLKNQIYDGKVILVTGSSSGIGQELAYRFALHGATVIVNYCRNRKGALRTADKIRETGKECIVIQADVSSGEAIEAMFQDIRNRFNHLHVLVNNAGVTLKRAFDQCSREDFISLFNTNLLAPFDCSKDALSIMPPGGCILNISSIHAICSMPDFEVYGALKAGMEGLTRNMALTLGPRKIRVNAIRCGWIQVDRDRIDPAAPLYHRSVERIPLRRAGETEDVASVALFLCSDRASYITGATIPVDGGYSIVLNTPRPMGFF